MLQAGALPVGSKGQAALTAWTCAAGAAEELVRWPSKADRKVTDVGSCLYAESGAMGCLVTAGGSTSNRSTQQHLHCLKFSPCLGAEG